MARPTLYYQKIDLYSSDLLAPEVSRPLLFAAESGQDEPQYKGCSEIASCGLDQTGEDGTSNNGTAKRFVRASVNTSVFAFSTKSLPGSCSSFIHQTALYAAIFPLRLTASLGGFAFRSCRRFLFHDSCLFHV